MNAPSVRSILVALDDSPRAALVFATAALLARRLGARLNLIRVLVNPPDIPPAAPTRPNGVDEILVRGARGALEALMNSDPGPQYASPIVAEGDPWREIVETGKELDVDLIVIGSHRYHGRMDRALGTVAAKVVNHADRDVLVVHERGADRGVRESG